MEDLIKSITETEEKAAAIKNDAVVKAGEIIEEARNRAAEIEATSAEQCAKYLSDALSAARIQADKDYNSYIQKSKADAKLYAADMKKHTDATVGKIVGRITDGNS
ncbi:MAG: hypothetical protein LUD19_01890 [Clostridia bacterium]|nr:hypothetical protein [Clostridia bacterium]